MLQGTNLSNKVMTELTKVKNIKSHIEFLRSIFIFGVVYIHLYTHPETNNEWVICGNYVAGYLAKLAVPIYFMITGALLIPKEEDFKSFIFRRVTKAISLMILFFAIQVIFLVYKGMTFTPFTLSVTFIRFLFNDYHLCPVNWFFYTYFSLILLLPFIRILAKSIPKQLYFYLFSLQFVFCAVAPAVFTILFHKKGFFYTSGCTNDLTAPYSTLYGIFYMILGYYLENRCQISKRLIMLLALASSISLIVVCTLQMTYNEGSSGTLINPLGFQPIFTAFIYITTKNFFTSHHLPAILNRIIIIVGSVAFSVMLTENIFRELLLNCLNVSSIELMQHFALKIELCITTCLFGFSVGIIMKRIPILNKFI